MCIYIFLLEETHSRQSLRRFLLVVPPRWNTLRSNEKQYQYKISHKVATVEIDPISFNDCQYYETNPFSVGIYEQ